jgi:riboflavin synthase
MFTGIIEHTAKITKNRASKNILTLSIKRPPEWTDLELGESIAMNGVCLTVMQIAKTSFGSQLPESLNLERAMKPSDRLGGHFVQGHVDTVGEVFKIDSTKGYELFVKFPAHNRKYVIYKGSITIDGVSLTVAEVKDDVLKVALIPYTLSHTTLGLLRPGDKVNLEFDMIGKYIVNLAEKGKTHAKSSPS